MYWFIEWVILKKSKRGSAAVETALLLLISITIILMLALFAFTILDKVKNGYESLVDGLGDD